MNASSVTRIQPSSLPGTPWRNGGGTTVEIAVGPQGPSGRPLWRFSIASLPVGTTQFSPLAGLDRVFIIIGDTGVRLNWSTCVADAEPWKPLLFNGIDPPACTAKAPTAALNVMADRSCMSIEVLPCNPRFIGVETMPGSTTLVYVGSGRASVGPVDARAGECLLITGRSALVRGPASILLARVAPAH